MDFKFIRFAFRLAKSISNKKQKLRNLVSCSIFFKASMFVYTCLVNDTRVLSTWMVAKRLPSSETQGKTGREKRQDESFQVRAKEPLGTDSHRTISKNSIGCRLLIGHKKCFVSLCPIGKQSFLLSSFREFVHDGYCLTTLPLFVHQSCACKGSFYFLLS